MTSMIVLVLVCIWHAIIPRIAADCGFEFARSSDIVILVVLSSIFVAIHVVFVLWIRKRVSKTLMPLNSYFFVLTRVCVCVSGC